MKVFTRKGAVRLAILLAVLALFLVWCWHSMIGMPGTSWSGPLPELTSGQRALAENLRSDVETLASDIGERNWMTPEAYARAAGFVEKRFADAGLAVTRHDFDVKETTFRNLEAEIAGSEEILVVGAHYDSVVGCPGANDNGTGVAALLALADRLADSKPSVTLRFVAFANEEPPFFLTEGMGSRAYAARCKARGEKVVGMISLETIGFYTDEADTQLYPPPLSAFYPSTGNFIAFVGNLSSRKLVHRSIATFRARAKFPSEGAALPGWIDGVYWSDHWSFWEEGYPALMVTDTAPFRYRSYHTQADTPDKIDYERFARVFEGLEAVVRELAGIEAPAGD